MDIQKACHESGVRIIRERAKYVEAVRPDGLHVFFDVISDKTPHLEAQTLRMLNAVRMHGKKADVIAAVGMVRGLQIARDYANRYDRESVATVTRIMYALLSGKAYRQRAKKLAKGSD